MSDSDRASAEPGALPARQAEGGPKAHTVTHVDQVSRRASESAGDKLAPHGTPHSFRSERERTPAALLCRAPKTQKAHRPLSDRWAFVLLCW